MVRQDQHKDIYVPCLHLIHSIQHADAWELVSGVERYHFLEDRVRQWRTRFRVSDKGFLGEKTHRAGHLPPPPHSRQGCASSQICGLQQIGTPHKHIQPPMLVLSISSTSYCAGLAFPACHHAGLTLLRIREWRRLPTLRGKDRVPSPDSIWYGESHAAQRGDSPACVSSVRAYRCYIGCSCAKVLRSLHPTRWPDLCSLPPLLLYRLIRLAVRVSHHRRQHESPRRETRPCRGD